MIIFLSSPTVADDNLKKSSQKNKEKALKSTHNSAEHCRLGSDQRQKTKKYFFFTFIVVFIKNIQKIKTNTGIEVRVENRMQQRMQITTEHGVFLLLLILDLRNRKLAGEKSTA